MAGWLIDLLRGTLRGRVVPHAPLAERTTLRVGGPADVLVLPADREDLERALSMFREREVPCFFLGNGSNLVVRDGGIRGAVVQLGEGFRRLEAAGEDAEALSFRAEGGVALPHLVRWTADRAISGFEALAGIPGSVGGALAMNAGAWGVEIGDRVEELEVMDPEGRIHRLHRSVLRFGYRSLDLPRGGVILSALFRGGVGSPEEVKGRVQEHLSRRRDRQPLHERSAGSVFKNPPGKAAGRLIEECGLKGLRVGDAEVSRLHANFIVNRGSATARQVMTLMEMIQERVHVERRIRLEPELITVGEWERCEPGARVRLPEEGT